MKEIANINQIYEAVININNYSKTQVKVDIISQDDLTTYSTNKIITQVAGGYLFSHTFTEVKKYKLKFKDTDTNSVLGYAVIIAQDVSASSDTEKITAIYNAINGKNLAEKSDVEVEKIGQYVKLKLVLSSDFLTGGTIAETFINITEMTGTNATLNGDYEKWGMRNFTSRFSDPVYENVPMFVNGSHAIYAVTDNPASGHQPSVDGGEYEWQISLANRYGEMTDATRTSVNDDGREMYSLNNVIFTGTGADIVIQSADIMETSSSYGSYSTSNTKIGEITNITRNTKAHYSVIISSNHVSDFTITRELEEGLNREQTLEAINNNVINQVNANSNLNNGVLWSLMADYYINTNQPLLHAYGGSVVIDNTNGTGTVGTVLLERESFVYTPNTIVSGLTDEQSAKLDLIQTNTSNITDVKVKIDKLEFDSNNNVYSKKRNNIY